MALLVALEFASGDGTEELDSTLFWFSLDDETTRLGKFWVYEGIVKISYYGVYMITTGNLQMYHLVDDSYG